MPLLRPPDQLDFSGPSIFLAGPIQGADRWQERAAELILALYPALFVASPRRSGDLEGQLSAEEYAEQVDWESRRLEQAGAEGVILFWLAREQEHSCERAYAQTTRFELAEWLTRHRFEGARVAVGVEEGFPGGRYVRYRIGRDFPGVPLCDDLEELCRQACALVGGSAPSL